MCCMLLSPMLQLESIQEQLDGLHEQLSTLSGRDHMQGLHTCVLYRLVYTVNEHYYVNLRIHVQRYTVLCFELKFAHTCVHH